MFCVRRYLSQLYNEMWAKVILLQIRKAICVKCYCEFYAMVNYNLSGVQIASRHSWLLLVEWIIQVHVYKCSDGTFINVLRLQKFPFSGAKCPLK